LLDLDQIYIFLLDTSSLVVIDDFFLYLDYLFYIVENKRILIVYKISVTN